jgi:polysaccharide pyruvyl transferase WcaK-like protein
VSEDSLVVLIADHVPLSNKGEEAIARGIADLLGDGRPVRVGVFDTVTDVVQRDGVTVFPSDWILGPREGRARSRMGVFAQDIVKVAQMRLGYYPRLGALTGSSSPRYAPLASFFDRADYVLVGHDGFFCVESCGTIHLAYKANKYVGVLGSGRSIKGRAAWGKRWLYRRAVREAYFWTLRERDSYEQMKALCPDEPKLTLAPDPAFAMQPAPSSDALHVLESYPQYVQARASGRPIVAVTVREKGVPYTYAFQGMDAEQKRQAHAKFVADILDGLMEERDVFVLFLPHSIEADASDIDAARHVAEAMSSRRDHVLILDVDLGARVLKSIIRECDFLIGERAHSLIASVSVATPFLALTNSKDRRTHGIIGDMCRCSEWIVNMDAAEACSAPEKAISLLDKRSDARAHLSDVGTDLLGRLRSLAEDIRSNKLKVHSDEAHALD